jgi:hypothetical protein
MPCCFQFTDDPDLNLADDPIPYISHGASQTPPTSDSFDFLGEEMADLQQLLVSMVTGNTIPFQNDSKYFFLLYII